MEFDLKDYLTKCRCCLESLQGKAVFNLTDFFIEKFFEVTQINVRKFSYKKNINKILSLNFRIRTLVVVLFLFLIK